MRRVYEGVTRLAWVVALAGVMMGFAPYDGPGLSIFRVADGEGAVGEEGSVEGDGLAWRPVEADALFHTLSSRYGGGGVLIYSEFPGRAGEPSGLLLLDLRHAGLSDLESSLFDVPSKRRVEPYYQEWRGSQDTFISERVFGEVQVLDIFRGDLNSALAIEYDLTFVALGPDGLLGSGDDRWRRVQGRAVTSPTVDQAVALEPALVFERRSDPVPFAPDGNIYVTCVGDAHVEEDTYEDDSYYYEDDEGGGCEGDTWEDDNTDPQESGGCAGESVVDEGEPDPAGGCDSSGDEYDESIFEEEEAYDGEFADSDGGDSGCDSGSDDPYDDSGGCDGDDATTDTTYDDDEEDSDDDDSLDCEGDTETEAEASEGGAWRGISGRQRAHLRRVLLSDDPRQARLMAQRHAATKPRFTREGRRTLRRLVGTMPFVLLGLLIQVWRRRL